MPAIDIRHVEQVYPNGVRALSPVSLQIEPGEFVTLLGPSGCGKSTLLKMVAGLLRPSAGHIEVNGQAPRAGAGNGLSFVFQEPTLMPWADVHRNVRLPLDLASMPRTEADARVDEALQLVGLQRFAKQRPNELSGGMKMRVSIARGLVTQPPLLLMDEPFGALDEITRNKLDDELLQLWHARGLTVLFVTHSITEAVFLSSRVVVMGARPGRVVADLPLEQGWPRDDDTRTTPRFNEAVRHLQHVLKAASHEAAAPEGGAQGAAA